MLTIALTGKSAGTINCELAEAVIEAKWLPAEAQK
jgi:hypothetical protein